LAVGNAIFLPLLLLLLLLLTLPVM